ncbi:MAG: ATP-binding protein [Candidatus Omnitrophica bacterium]|nr:ATP-binding protein [Candidatus Omnitrophota bacterium]
MFKDRIPNDSRVLKEESNRLMRELEKSGVSEDLIFDIHVGFEEALRNAMVHGNRNDPDKMVSIEVRLLPDAVLIIIEDEGEGFDHMDIPDPTTDDNLLKEGGRGVYLIHRLMDEVEYANKGRRVIMKKFLRKSPAKMNGGTDADQC